jgi:hypothetical protein
VIVVMMGTRVSSALACVLSFGASACQFETSPLSSQAAACGLASGLQCTTMNAASSSDAGTPLDFGPQPPQMTAPAQTPSAMQPNAPPQAPGQSQSQDAGAKPQPAAHDAGAQPPPEQDASDAAVMPSDAGMSTDGAAPADASPPDTTQRGAVYAPCSANAECASGLCTVDPSSGAPAGSRGYCTTACGTNGWQNGNGWTGTGGSGDPGSDPIACAQPSSGSVSASCRFPGVCLLDACDTGRDCPDGLECAQTQTPTASPDGMVVWVSACQGGAAP